MRSVKPHLQHTGTRMTKRMLPFNLVYHDKDQQLTLALHDNPVTLTRDEVDGLIFHLDSFLFDMDRERKPQRSADGGWKMLAPVFRIGAIPPSLLFQYVK